MRRLGAELGVQPSALYHHFANKQTLLAAVADEILARGRRAPRPADAWDARVVALCLELRDAMLAYRDGAEVVATVHAFGLGAGAPYDELAAALARRRLRRRAGARPPPARCCTSSSATSPTSRPTSRPAARARSTTGPARGPTSSWASRSSWTASGCAQRRPPASRGGAQENQPGARAATRPGPARPRPPG